MPGPWIYRAQIVRVIDGDTVDLHVARETDFGFRMYMELSAVMRFRISGIDTPEVVGATRAMGLLAADFVREQLCDARAIEVESLGEPDKYGGRWDAVVRLRSDPAPFVLPPVWTDLAELLIARGYARAYTGRGARPEWNPAAAYPLSVLRAAP
jgi:endonuclease YncB( thermonuclease family)